MSESRSFFGDYHEMAHIWARIQAFNQVSKFLLFKPAASTMLKIKLSTASIFVNEGLFIYIYFLLFEKIHQNGISRAGEKTSPTISLIFRKMIAYKY